MMENKQEQRHVPNNNNAIIVIAVGCCYDIARVLCACRQKCLTEYGPAHS